MSKRFKITIADGKWTGTGDARVLYARSGQKLGYVVKEKGKWRASDYSTSRSYKSMSAAKRYVIRQLAKPEGSK